MEIKVNIPQNDYTQPTEIRENVVQMICDVFLDRRAGWYHNVFHPVSDGNYRTRHKGLRVHKSSGKAWKFATNANDCSKNEEFIGIRGCEMKAAFNALIKAGYYMFEVFEYDTWKGYICDNKPFYENGTQVFTFCDFID